MEPALQYCTHLIYGYAGISDETYKLVSLNEHFDVTKDNYRAITNLKRRFPGLRVLLAVGGNEDLNGDGDDKNLKYRTLVLPRHLRNITQITLKLYILILDRIAGTQNGLCELRSHSSQEFRFRRFGSRLGVPRNETEKDPQLYR